MKLASALWSVAFCCFPYVASESVWFRVVRRTNIPIDNRIRKSVIHSNQLRGGYRFALQISRCAST